ncbi:hypothetical protein [Microbacterium jiangjiandongii]|uniref:hypothetical protein n=1 Tax=Microbacterium jiangjiandongii TaxID=3049071 RepID=UPI00214B59F9|nr:hypothetical protein [Microbacterium sp. zg.Y843]MCR2815870.1 hypothetical protein [Microbacterium sp. zg.Y843]
MLALLRSALVRTTHLVWNAGEISLDRRFLVGRAAMLPVIALVRARRGEVAQVGIGIRHPGRRVGRIIRLFASMGTFVGWRDEASRNAVGVGTVTPDWAFLEGSDMEELEARHASSSSSPIVAISMRGDRSEPLDSWLASVATSLAELGARAVVVCQVRRDAERAKWLAGRLGAELLDWPDGLDHAEQEKRVRACYSSATWVASDRLHSVIVGMTEGAVPLDLIPDRSRKIARTLASADLALFSVMGAVARLEEDRRAVRAAVIAARNRLTDVTRAMSGALGGRTRAERPIRVLHSMAAPDGTTKYARHMAATESFFVKPKFFTWRRAVLGRYDVFHIHWPEHLVPGGASLTASIRYLLASLLIRRMRRRQVPVVRTLHNVAPHAGAVSGRGGVLHRSIDELTKVEIHLVPGDSAVSFGHVVLIPHGHYREPYATFPPAGCDPGRVLYFGMMKAYKGIPELLEAASGSGIASLRLVGAPSDAALVSQIRQRAAEDARVTYRFGFVQDEELASEILMSVLCVFPYRELHSSGAVLVALSLERPVLVPRTPSTIALQSEVGAEWVRIYDVLDANELNNASIWASERAQGARPNLAGRSWEIVRASHGSAYRHAMS